MHHVTYKQNVIPDPEVTPYSITHYNSDKFK